MTGMTIAVCLTVISLSSLVWFVASVHVASDADDREDELMRRIEHGDCRLSDLLK